MATESQPISLSGWALVLGASSGFGAATSMALARAGLNVFGVHLDRKATLPNAERLVAEIKGVGREARFYNINAARRTRRGARRRRGTWSASCASGARRASSA